MCENELDHHIIEDLQVLIHNADVFGSMYSQINNSIKNKGKIRKIMHRLYDYALIIVFLYNINVIIWG